MPHKDILEHSRLLFAQIMSMSSVRTPLVIENVLAGKLADAFDVSASSMGYRLREWPIKVNDKIRTAIRDKLDFLE